jgi:hypothetical protein
MKNKITQIITLMFLLSMHGIVMAHGMPKHTTKTLIQSFVIEEPYSSKTEIASNILKLEITKTEENKFILESFKSTTGKTTHFFKPQYSDYMIEMLQNDRVVFSGGFNNPNIIRHEIIDEYGNWQQKRIIKDSARLIFRVPFNKSANKRIINIYKMEVASE